MNKESYRAIAEGLLFAAGDEGLTCRQMAHALELTTNEVTAILEDLKQEYQTPERGLQIMHSNELYYLATKREHSKFYKRLLEAPQTNKLSQAALETLAIIAYKQPITRIEIEEVRGVKSERPIQTLAARNLIEENGRKEGIGRPILYGTTLEFLTYFGLSSLEELPPLPEHVEDDEQEADLFFENFSFEPENDNS